MGGFMRGSAIRLLSYQYKTGRTFIALSMLLSLASFGIYVSEANQWPNEIEKCGHKGRTHRLLDFLFNLFFLLHFLIRWAAADNKLLFWVDLFSLLDYCTVPPGLLAFALQRSWMGLRFMRIFRLFNLAEVLHNLNIIKSASGLRLCQLCSFFCAVWLAGKIKIHKEFFYASYSGKFSCNLPANPWRATCHCSLKLLGKPAFRHFICLHKLHQISTSKDSIFLLN